jgi:hypothetical protein
MLGCSSIVDQSARQLAGGVLAGLPYSETPNLLSTAREN